MVFQLATLEHWTFEDRSGFLWLLPVDRAFSTNHQHSSKRSWIQTFWNVVLENPYKHVIFSRVVKRWTFSLKLLMQRRFQGSNQVLTWRDRWFCNSLTFEHRTFENRSGFLWLPPVDQTFSTNHKHSSERSRFQIFGNVVVEKSL